MINVCFTGHRPQGLTRKGSEIMHDLEKYIDASIEKGVETFICGGAMGVDTIAALVVLARKKTHKNVKLVLALPYKGFDNRFDKWHRAQLATTIKYADYVHYISDKYYNGVYHDRDKYMVNNSSFVIAVTSGKPSGTEYTIKYAEQNNKPVFKINA